MEGHSGPEDRTAEDVRCQRARILKDKLMKWIAFVLTFMIAAGPAVAGPVNTADIAAGATWVVHLDAEALVGSGVGDWLLKRGRQRDLDQKLAEFAGTFGFDPTKDLASATLYGTSYEPTSGVAVLKGNFDKQKLLDLLDEARGHEESEYGGYTVHRWRQKAKDKRDDGVRYGTFHSEQVVVIARSRSTLEAALDVLDGQVAAPEVVPEVSAGTFLFAVAKGIPADETGDRARFLKKVSGGFIEMGEAGDSAFLNLKFTARKTEDARRLRQILNGLLAMLSMVAEQQEERDGRAPDWAPLIEGAEAGGAGDSIELGISVKTQALIEVAEARQERKAARPGVP